MNPNFTTVAAWSYGLAGFGYAAFALYLRFGLRGGLRGLALLCAVGLTAAWALLNLAFALTQAPVLLGARRDRSTCCASAPGTRSCCC